MTLAHIKLWAKSSTFLYPLLLSLVAALIFWSAFSYLPEKGRRNKLRPVVESDMLHVYQRLFSIFDLVMRYQPRTTSDFKVSIRGGLLTSDDIRMGLQNKCLNINYLIDPKVNDVLMPIGQKIYDTAKEIDHLVNKIFNLSQYASPEEILLLEQIRAELKRYDYDENIGSKKAAIKFGDQYFYPLIPTLSYRAKNFDDLYRLFLDFQNLVLFKNECSGRNCHLYRIQVLFYSRQYARAKREIKARKNTGSNDNALYNNFLAVCEFHLNNKNKCYDLTEEIYKERPYGGNLVASRSILKHLVIDANILEILNRHYTEEEIQRLWNSIETESKTIDHFIKTNKSLSRYFSTKDSKLEPVK